ncbi:MAG: DNA ligase D [Candidatus Cyclobacteriaceae bacterium M3_2C_046]
MALKEYKTKRAFNNTPEPQGGKPSARKLKFVVQKHAASRLHYDFRLEMDGVLKSWAVPKGPSLNPADKRLAMQTEDHPFDYLDFEGIIPRDNYGAGTVIVWDQGHFEAMDGKTKKEQEKYLLQGLEKGSLKFKLNGERIKGEYALVRTPKRAENAWLLIKHRDQYAEEVDVLEQDTSVISGKTLDQMEVDEDAPHWSNNRSKSSKYVGSGNRQGEKSADPVNKTRGKVARNTKKLPAFSETDLEPILKGLDQKHRSEMPLDIEPMLATLVNKPVEGDYIFEVKWDGFRALGYKDRDHVALRSRNNKSFNEKFYPVFDALKEWPVNVVFDGEIVVLDKQGLPDFSALQNWRSEADGRLVYYVFDLLWLEGYNLMDLPLAERRKILVQVIPAQDIIRLSDHFEISGKEFFNLIDKMGLEGIIAKKSQSTYQPGKRNKTWLKIKTEKQQEVVIGGYTINENTSKKFSSLLTGVFEDGELVFTGAVGTGFNQKMQEDILKRLKPHQIDHSPFSQEPEYNKPSRFRPNPPRAEVFWVKPEVVAEIAYRTVTTDGSFRHPSFRGIREDKAAKDIGWEHSTPAEEIKDQEQKAMKDQLFKGERQPERKTLLNPSEEIQVKTIESRELKFPNLSKIFWPEEQVTKRDMLNYYYQIAPFILPYLKDRPQTLNRFPNGIHQKSFYQKDVTGKVPDWLETYKFYSEADQREKQFAVCTDEASLLYLAALACIEMNPWSSRQQNPDHPDWCIIDLDPDQNPFEQVIEAARVTHQVLEVLELPACCKTSGSTGLHIYIPLGAKYTYEDSKEFARALTRVVQKQLPGFTSVERLTSKRKGRIYLDFLQNRPQATVAGPYSLRPKPGAPVSMPLHWDEVKPGLQISDYTIFNAVERAREVGDIFQGVLGPGVDLEQARKSLDQI